MLSMVDSTNCAMALGNLSDSDDWKITPHLSPCQTQVSKQGSKQIMKLTAFQHEVKKRHTEHEVYSVHSKTVLALKNEHLKRHY